MDKEYIDRQELQIQLNKRWNFLVGEYGSTDEYVKGFEEAMDKFEDTPAADVAPVVHGRWEPRKDAPGFCNCSVCHNCNVYDEWPNDEKWKYCPQCGAKMDLEAPNAQT